MRKLAAAVVCMGIGVLLTTGPLSAHHAFSAEFDVSKPITLKGQLTELRWVNPHGWVFVDVKSDAGTMVNWAVEIGAPNALLRRGLRKTDFPPGMEIVIDGYRAKDGTPTANGITVKFPDGRNFFAGSSGTGAPDAPPR